LSGSRLSASPAAALTLRANFVAQIASGEPDLEGAKKLVAFE
jgi:hypothetical protein